MRKLQIILLTLRLAGTPNYYKGIDKPNFWQWLYQWRLSIKTAYKVAKIRYEA